MVEAMLDEKALLRDIIKESYYEFLKEMWQTINAEPLRLNWHIELLCEELQLVCERVKRGLPKKYDLIINISPGTTKSSAASVFLLPWIWTAMPWCKAICGSHTHELVLDLSRKSRDVVLSEKYRELFPDIELREDQNTKSYFVNTKGGMRFSCTVAGKTPTGMHGHIHIIDDPIDPDQALSDLETSAANNWMEETLSTRKVDKSVTPLILIMQRLAQNDPSGFLMSFKNRRIKHICLPAELTENVNPPYLRKFYNNGLMDPNRLSRDVLDEFRDRGEYFYAGQFLQHPVPPGGGQFKTDRFKIEEKMLPREEFRKVVRYWDKAGSSKKGAAWTVGVLMGVTKDVVPQYWILDVKRFREESARREWLIKQTAAQDGRDVIIGIEQEGGSGGKESAENTIARLGGYRAKVLIPKGDKEWRADPLSTQVNAGNVHLLKAEWNHEFIEEVKFFPNSRFKDQVDASSGAFSLLFKLRRRVGAF